MKSVMSLPQRVVRKLAREVNKRVEVRKLDKQQADFSDAVKHISGPVKFFASSEDVVVVCLVRNGSAYIDEFFRHYRSMGVKYFAFLDNGSDDDTADKISADQDTILLHTLAPYKDFKFLMKRYLVHRFGLQNWVLCVDIDELFDFPLRDGRPIGSLLRYLNANRYSAVAAYMLDLFPSADAPSDAWRDTHVFYNNLHLRSEPYGREYVDNIKIKFDVNMLYGGIRNTKFAIEPLLTKHPLVRRVRGLDFYHHHYVRNAALADFTSVLLHYKYVGEFVARFQDAIVREQYYNDSAEYKGYVEALKRDNTFSLFDEDARRLSHVDQLIEEGFISVSDKFATAMGRPRT